jgi:hypothetical protein
MDSASWAKARLKQDKEARTRKVKMGKVGRWIVLLSECEVSLLI